MNKLFETSGGSLYEVRGNKIRRVCGTKAPTGHFGADGVWHSFDSISGIEIGAPVSVIWGFENIGDKMKVNSTVISNVVSIIDAEPLTESPQPVAP